MRKLFFQFLQPQYSFVHGGEISHHESQIFGILSWAISFLRNVIWLHVTCHGGIGHTRASACKAPQIEARRLFPVLVDRRDQIRPIAIVALWTGMRQGEILDLNWEQVEFEQKAIYVASIQDRTTMKNSDEQPVKWNSGRLK